jgi:hypothetical protein
MLAYILITYTLFIYGALQQFLTIEIRISFVAIQRKKIKQNIVLDTTTGFFDVAYSRNDYGRRSSSP